MIRPVEHLVVASKMYPMAWDQVDMFRASRGVDLPKWPAWCFMPMAAWYAIVSEGRRLSPDLASDVGRLAAIGTWRYSQGVYRLDPDFLGALTGSVVSGPIPSDVLHRLPEWSLYVETPGMTWNGGVMYGFWAHLEWDVNTERHELRLLIDAEQELTPIPIHIGPWTVTEAIDRAIGEAVRQASTVGINLSTNTDDIEGLSAAVNPLVSILLYLCSDEPDIDDERQPGSHPEKPSPKKTKRGWRLFPADKPRIWSVGGAIGKQLRDNGSDDGANGRTTKAHLRRGHWHGYWTGSKAEQQKFKYNWISPMVVSGHKDEE